MSTSPPRRGKAFPPKSPDAELDLRRVVDTIPQLVWSAFPDGSVEFCNQRWLECTGLTAEQAQGWGWRAAIHPGDLDKLVATWRRVLAEGVPGEAAARMRMADGTFRWFLIRATPLCDDKGQIVRWYGTNTDIDERKRAEEALRESEQRFRLVADTAPVLIWMSGTDKLCTYFNKPWLDFTGRSMENELGNGWAEGVYQEDLQRCLDTYTHSFDRRKEFRMEYRLRRHDGKYRWIFDIGVPRFNHDGSFAGYIGSCVDVTDRQFALRELALANDRLRLAMEAGTSVWWDLDVKSGRDLWFGDLHTIFGIESGNYAASAEDFIRYVHPDDRQQVSEALAHARQNRKLYAAEFRIVRPDGTVRWLVARGKFYYATNGEPERMLGVSLDITERKRGEEVLSGVSRKLIEAQEQERTRIARDLHDDIGQRLALLAIRIEQLETDLPSSSVGILSRMDELRKQTLEISTDVQTLAHELHSSKLEYLGIAAAIRSFCNEFGEQQKVEIDFTQKDIPRTLPQEISLCLFRVLQEALHNAVKHSGVRHFEVELRGASDAIHLTMRDLGLGFDPEAAMKSRGLGLTSMEERLKLMDGELLIDSKPNQGTTIHARVPLTAARNSARAAG